MYLTHMYQYSLKYMHAYIYVTYFLYVFSTFVVTRDIDISVVTDKFIQS
jgi:hypothetical protein